MWGSNKRSHLAHPPWEVMHALVLILSSSVNVLAEHWLYEFIGVRCCINRIDMLSEEVVRVIAMFVLGKTVDLIKAKFEKL